MPTAEQWTTIILALIAIVPTLMASILGYLTLIQSKDNSKTSQDINNKADHIVRTTESTHSLANGSNTVLQNQLLAANEKIAGLEKTVMQFMLTAKSVPDKLSVEIVDSKKDQKQ